MPTTQRRAVITGCGVVAPPGSDSTAVLGCAVQPAVAACGPIQGFDTSGAARALRRRGSDFDVNQYIDKKERKRLAIMPRPLQLGLAAAHLAMQDAALDNRSAIPIASASSSAAARFPVPGRSRAGCPAQQRQARRNRHEEMGHAWAFPPCLPCGCSTSCPTCSPATCRSCTMPAAR